MATLKSLIKADDHIRGRAIATITLVEFGDYECVHCGSAYPLIQRLLAEFETKLRFVFRNFPIVESHPYAYPAALAAEAANRQGKFWEMHDIIYENQQYLNKLFFLQLAGRLHLDIAQFQTDWRTQSSRNKIESDFKSGVQSGVNGTPAFFLNGDRVQTYDETYKSLKDAVTRLP